MVDEGTTWPSRIVRVNGNRAGFFTFDSASDSCVNEASIVLSLLREDVDVRPDRVYGQRPLEEAEVKDSTLWWNG